jgi:hypothetical protein
MRVVMELLEERNVSLERRPAVSDALLVKAVSGIKRPIWWMHWL